MDEGRSVAAFVASVVLVHDDPQICDSNHHFARIVERARESFCRQFKGSNYAAQDPTAIDEER